MLELSTVSFNAGRTVSTPSIIIWMHSHAKADVCGVYMVISSAI